MMIKVAVAEVSVPFLVFARSAVGAAVLCPVALRGRGFAALKGHWNAVAIFALIEMIVPWGLLAHGQTRLSSSTAALIVAATPILTVLIGKLVGGAERLGRARWMGLVLGFAGVGVLTAPESHGQLGSIAAIVIAAACYAGGSIVAARWLKNVPATAMTVACLAIAAGVYLLPALVTWPQSLPSISVIAAIGALGAVCTALAFACFFLLIREVGAERAVVITYVAPAVAVASGVTLLSEPLDARIVVSFGLILCGTYLATRRRSGTRSLRGRNALRQHRRPE